MSEQIDRFQFMMDQRRKFMKEMAALTGLAMVSSAELVRAAPVSITGDQESKDMNWGSIKGRLLYDGKIPERKEVDLDKIELSPTDLEWFRSMGPILNEDWVVEKKNKAVQWVYVWLIPEDVLIDGKRNKKAKKTLEIHKDLKDIPVDKKIVHVDQNPQGYVPHAVAMREGMKLNMRNIGPVPHVFKFSGFVNEEFTKAMPPKKEILIEGLKTERGANQVSCPPHPWEKMWLRIFNHPYYAVTDKHGNFEIKNAPAGKCRIVVWQETMGFKSKGRLAKYGDVIEIEGGAMKNLGDIKIKAKVEDGNEAEAKGAEAKTETNKP